MAISATSLDQLIKPELKTEYDREINGLCSDVYNAANHRWLPRTCCEKHAKFDKRVPGLFKTEYEGDEMIGLCSKTYIVSRGEEFKFSSKGISKRYVEDPIKTFKEVLDQQKPQSGTNKGFRARENGIFSYQQTRCGFSYFYGKRRVLDDGIHTVPLDVTLCPVKASKPSKETIELDEQDKILVQLLSTNFA